MDIIMKKRKIFSAISALMMTIFAVGSLKTSAATVNLSEQQKKEYYKQYEEIVDEINSGEPNATLELVPFEEFNSEDYLEPSEFEKYAAERADVKFTPTLVSKSGSGITPFITVSASKTETVKSNETSAVIIKGSFNTQYNSSTKRQMFSGINSITSSSSKGIWRQTGYTPTLIDGGRTYEIIVGGKLTINSLTSMHNITVEFYCNANGSVS